VDFGYFEPGLSFGGHGLLGSWQKDSLPDAFTTTILKQRPLPSPHKMRERETREKNESLFSSYYELSLFVPPKSSQ
jgi:hypothetical protein